MASIHKEIYLNAAADDVWSAVRDLGRVHQRLAVGFVTETHLEGDARIVTFANGFTVRELIVDIDDRARRFAYAAVGGRSTHHNASMQVFDAPDGGSRLVWIADFLPHDAAAAIGGMMAQGADAMKRTLERRSAGGLRDR
jgi:carbon monoxide dehydrogenase subunit G